MLKPLAPYTETLTIITSISSTLIALCALVFTFVQIRKSDSHNTLMVTPHLEGHAQIDLGEETYKYSIINNGIGPAVVKKVEIHIAGKIIKSEDIVETAIQTLFSNISDDAFGHETITPNSFISPNQVLEVISINSLLGISPSEVRKAVETNARILIEYESIYKKKSLFDSSLKITTRPIKAPTL